MKGRANGIRVSIAILAVLLLVLVPLAFAHRHPGRGVLAGKHCQVCLSPVLSTSLMTTVPALAAPAESPFRLVPAVQADLYSPDTIARTRAPPATSL